MRRLFVILILLLCMVFPIAAQTNIERGNEAYRLRDYETAIMLYEEAIATGTRNGATFYNLGNAYYAVEDWGNAILNYRRAAVYMPRDVDLSVNIARVRANGTTSTTDESNPLHQLATLTTEVFTQFELGILVFVLWLVFFMMLILGIVRGMQDTNFQMILGIMGVVLLAGLILLGSRLYVETLQPTSVVLSDSVTVMSGPGEDYLSIYSIHAAAEVRIMEEVDGWVRFALPDGRGGWVLRQELGVVNENL